jgi:hypothetical protein
MLNLKMEKILVKQNKLNKKAFLVRVASNSMFCCC